MEACLGVWRAVEKGLEGPQRAPRGDMARGEAWEDPHVTGSCGPGRERTLSSAGLGGGPERGESQGAFGVCGEDAWKAGGGGSGEEAWAQRGLRVQGGGQSDHSNTGTAITSRQGGSS